MRNFSVFYRFYMGFLENIESFRTCMSGVFLGFFLSFLIVDLPLFNRFWLIVDGFIRICLFWVSCLNSKLSVCLFNFIVVIYPFWFVWLLRNPEKLKENWYLKPLYYGFWIWFLKKKRFILCWVLLLFSIFQNPCLNLVNQDIRTPNWSNQTKAWGVLLWSDSVYLVCFLLCQATIIEYQGLI